MLLSLLDGYVPFLKGKKDKDDSQSQPQERYQWGEKAPNNLRF